MVSLKKILKKNQIMISALAIMIAVAGYLNFAGTKIGEEDFLSTDGSDSELTYEVSDISDEDMYAISIKDEEDGSIKDYSDNDSSDIESLDSEYTANTDNYLSDNVKITGNSDDSLAASTSNGVLADNSEAEAQNVGESADEIPGEAVFTSTTAVTSLDGAKLLKEQTRAKNKEALMDIINNESLTDTAKQEAIDDMLQMTQTAQKEADAEMLLEAKGYNEAVVSIGDNVADVMVGADSLTDAQTAQIMDIVQRKTDILPENIVITVSKVKSDE